MHDGGRSTSSISPYTLDEEKRLQALHRYDILDTVPEVAFDRITELAAHMFDAPMAAVSFIDRDRHWFKSSLGLEADELSRGDSFCARTIEAGEVMVVQNAANEEPFASFSSVQSDPGIRFYAGAPLMTGDGYALGTLCVLDTKPRPKPKRTKLRHLDHLASLVMGELDLRLEMQRRRQQTQSLRQTAQRAEIARATAENARAAAEQARMRAEEASRSKSQFLSGMAHDIRSPISVIDGYAQLLDRDVDGSHTEYVQQILRAAGHLNGMADSLSELAELESGAMDLTLQNVDIGPLITETVSALTPRAQDADITLHAETPERPILAHINSEALRRVLDNLISNAIKYSGTGDRVVVRAHSPDPRSRWICVEVSDTGPGIDREFLDVMYEPFTQHDTSANGSGLGLAVTKELLEAMDARIDVTSSPGDGTTFFVNVLSTQAIRTDDASTQAEVLPAPQSSEHSQQPSQPTAS